MSRTYLDLIKRKRDGAVLTRTEIEHLVQAIADGAVPDYQIGALLMAMYIRGLSAEETLDLTLAMVASGDTVDLSKVDGFKADKHSTGGVGDKVTLVLGPLVAAAGIKFPKLSGRGLAHTGGTLDKLEAIPGMRVNLTLDEFVDQVKRIGIAVTGQTLELVPADGIIYGLRDQTGTVDSKPLIASSVMSKKIAAGADGILLDVKCGRGAFMQTLDDAVGLATQMVEIGTAAGKVTRAVVTSMDEPLGLAVGNALEVKEAVETLQGVGPEDLREEVLFLGSLILVMAGMASDEGAGRAILQPLLESGTAFETLCRMVSAQGGDVRVIEDPNRLPRATRIIQVEATADGFVHGVDALEIGAVAMELGAGRRAKDEPVAAEAGVMIRAKPGGGSIHRGELLAELHVATGREADIRPADLEVRARQAFEMGPSAPARRHPVLATVP